MKNDGFALAGGGDVLTDYGHVTAVFRSSSILFCWPERRGKRVHGPTCTCEKDFEHWRGKGNRTRQDAELLLCSPWGLDASLHSLHVHLLSPGLFVSVPDSACAPHLAPEASCHWWLLFQAH